MKTNMRIVLVSVAFLAIASGCVKENQMPNNEGANHKVTIFASIPDEGMETKVTPSQDAIKTAVKLAWENTDYIYVNSEKFSVVTISADGKTAEFSGNDPGSGPYNITYSNIDNVVEQTQSVDGNLEHLKYAAAIAGADSYENLSFSSTWATAHGATFTSSSVLELRAKLPASIASSVQKVIFTFPENITVDNKRITVSLTTPGVQSGDNILDVYATLPDGNINLPNILVQFQVSDKAYEKYSAYREFASSNVIAAGTTQYLGIDCSNIESYANASSTNIGESTNPYLIGDKFQLNYLHTAMKTGTTYVKLVDDVDLNSEAWTPLNYAGTYDKGIDFNGNGKIISKLYSNYSTYPSFFGVLKGSCYDVTFMDANIECSAAKSCGILGGYGGTISVAETVIHADVTRVHVHGKVKLTGNKTGVGGMFGVAGDATISRCSANVEVHSGKNYVGGLVGYSTKVQISDCWVGGSVRGDQRVGGIIGGLNGNNDAIRNCYAVNKLYVMKGDVKEYAALRSVGGIVGHANQDKSDRMETREPGNVVSGCIAWQEELKTRDQTSVDDYYSSGAIVAFGATHNTYENCYRNPNLDFRDYSSAFLLYDQDNSSPNSPLTHQAVAGSTYNYPYHGKAAAVGKTLSEVAQSLGWDGNIWDFSTDIPTLK